MRLPEIVLLGLVSLVCDSGHGQQGAPATQVTAQEEVTVTSTRSAELVGETARTIDVLDERELHQYPAVTLDEALRQHAGFELFRRSSSRVQNPTSQGISLRGLGSTAASRTLVLEDGAPLNDPFGGWIHWNENPAPAVESVTLLTGGGSDLYGSSALGGVIALVPARPAEDRVDLTASGGSQDTQDLAGLVSAPGKLVGGLLAAEVLRTAGYVQVDPKVAGAIDTPSNVHSESFRTELGRRALRSPRPFLTADALNEARGNATPLQTNATRLWRYLAGYDTEDDHPFTARVRAFGSDEGYRQTFSAIAPSRNSEVLTRQQRVRSEEFGGTADATYRRGAFALVTGADLRDLRATDKETPFTAGSASGQQNTSARQRFVGGFAEVLGAYRHWSGTGTLRVDAASNFSVHQLSQTGNGVPLVTVPPGRTEMVTSPRVGLVRSFDLGLTLHAAAFRAFRAPTMNELYRTGQVGQETTRANADLASERATGWELGAEYLRLPAGSRMTATYFWTEINRPVSAVLVSQTATSITNLRENLGQIRSQGIEMAVDVRPGKALSGRLGYQYANATVTQFSVEPALVGKRIPQVERHSATGQLRASNARLGELTLAARFGGRAFDDSSNLFPLAHFFALDLSGEHQLSPRLAVSFLVENLTNQRQQVARTPVLTLGSPVFAEGGVRLRLDRARALSQP